MGCTVREVYDRLHVKRDSGKSSFGTEWKVSTKAQVHSVGFGERGFRQSGMGFELEQCYGVCT